MDRRGFLKRLAAATAAVAATAEIDPERLLWTPGKKTIFLPPEKALVTAESVAVQQIRNEYESKALLQIEHGVRPATTKEIQDVARGSALREYVVGSDSRYVLTLNTERGQISQSFDTHWNPIGSPQEVQRFRQAEADWSTALYRQGRQRYS
jgi:hypothetical protein